MAKLKAYDWDYFDFNKNKPQEFINNPAKYIENNFRNLFGKEYNKENLINLVLEEWDYYTHPENFKNTKEMMMKESGNLDLFYMDLEQRGITEEIALTEGHHDIQKRFIGKSFDDIIKKDLAEKDYTVHRGSRTIDVSLQDSMMNLKFDNPEDFNILNNAIEFNNSTYGGWKAYDYGKKNERLIKDAPTFFDHYANNLKKEGSYTERYITNYLDDIQKKAEEFGYNIDLQGIINERKIQAQAEKSFIHESNAMNREYRVKQDRINQIEEEMKKFKHDSPEYKALELERNNIEVSLRDWKGTHQTLELPPPREGAPMFEGGAVPSVIANNPEFGVNYNINTNASSTVSSTVDNSPLGKLNRLMSKSNVEKKMWTNRDFVFGDDFINNQEFQNKVLDFYSQDGRKEDLFNKLARLDNYSADKFYYQTYSNAFEAYKELEGLDNAGMQKKVIERLKSLGYTEKDFRHHFETLREGADFINWQGSRKFIDYDSSLYNSANNVHTAPNTQSTASETITPEIQEEIKRLTEEARQRFEAQQQAEYDQKMEQIKNDYDIEAERIEKEFGQGTRHKEDTSKANNTDNAEQQQAQQQHRKIDQNDPASWTDDDIKYMADGDPESMDYLIKKREQARQRQNRNNNQQQTQQQQAEQQAEQQVDPNTEPKFATEEELNPENDPIKKNKSKTAAGGVDDSIKTFVDPSGFTDLDQFADLTDDEIQTYLKTLNNVDRQAAYDDILQKRQLAKAQRVLSDPEKYLDEFFSIQPLDGPTGKYDPQGGWIPPSEDYKNLKGYSRPELDIDVDDSGNATLNKTGGTIHVGDAKPKIKPRASQGDDIFGWLKKHKLGLGDAINVLFSIGSYNEARREGHGVVSSAARAAGQFVMGELTGFWGGLAFQAAKAVPKMAIKGTELLYKENRKMNSAANSQVFGGVQFQDTQQLATMRQSGMEMAKMAQYNLQQTLMGNEASYLHR